jgi:hypothetical protein
MYLYLPALGVVVGLYFGESNFSVRRCIEEQEAPLRDPRHVEESSLLLDPEDLLPARDRMLLFSSPH